MKMTWFEMMRVFRMADDGNGGGGAPAPAATEPPKADPPPAEPPAPPAEPPKTEEPPGSLLTKPAATATEPPKEPSKTEPPALPELAAYEAIKPPEGEAAKSWDEGTMKAVAPILREAGLSVEQSQKVAHGYAAMVQAHQAEQARLVEEHVANLIKESRATFTPEQIDNANNAFKKIATPEMQEFFDNPLIGNNKAFLGVFVQLWEYIKDDTLPGGNIPPAPPAKTFDERMYGGTTGNSQQ